MSESIRITKAKEMAEGQGAEVKRAFPIQEVQNIDPFVLFDEFFVEPPADFPMHYHHGFEAITYMLDGAFEHEDSNGNSGKIEEGEVQYMVTGKGLKHSEMPGTDEMNHGLQVWMNLSEELGELEPEYKKVNATELPVEEGNNEKITTIVGDGSPLVLHNSIKFYHISLRNEKNLKRKLNPQLTNFIYIIEGSGQISEKFEIEEGNLAVLEGKKLEVRSDKKLEFALGSGAPLNEPIVLGKTVG